ncbi:isoleucine-tRNA ligase [Pseudogymnoascus australis]
MPAVLPTRHYLQSVCADRKSVLGGGNEAVLALLGFQVLGVHKHEHKYPYDWRTKLPVIVRATEQWFADVGSIRIKRWKSLDNVKFIPENSRSRLESFIKGEANGVFPGNEPGVFPSLLCTMKVARLY